MRVREVRAVKSDRQMARGIFRRKAAFVLLLLVVCLSSSGKSATPHSVQSRFDVRRSIEMRRLIPLRHGAESGRARPFAVLFSPDRRFFLAQTRRGDLRLDANVEQLLLWNTDAVLRALRTRSRAASIEPIVLFENVAQSDENALSNVQWIGDFEVAFTGRGDNGHQQVFSVDITTRRAIQLTRSDTDVVSFATASSHLVYFARVSPKRRTAEIVGEHSWSEMLAPTDAFNAPIELFHTYRGGSPMRVDAPAVAPYETDIWLSPTGDYAITLAPVTNVPEEWSRYRVFDRETENWSKQTEIRDPTSTRLFGRTYYQLVNLRTNQVRPLIEAPDGTLSRVRTPRTVFWANDGRRAIVSHTYLPLGETEPSGCGVEDRQRNVFVAEVDVTTLHATPVLPLPFLTLEEYRRGMQLEPVIQLEWHAGAEELVAVRRRLHGVKVREGYREVDGVWRRVPIEDVTLAAALSLEIRESDTERPKLYAVGRDCRCSMELFDPAPELNDVSFGRSDVLRWVDERGRAWSAGLIYPVGYVPGRKYPLVVQTHGFRRKEFLIDGPDAVTTAFAAQPLANAGFVVLQMNEGPAVTMGPDEARSVSAAWKSAIRKLVEMGIVDQTRVGLIAWSRTGLHVLDLLARDPDLLGAVVISDSVQHGYLQYALRQRDPDYLRDLVQATGGTPEAVGYDKWFRTNPLYNLGEGRTAIRLEGISVDGLLAMWETYANLAEQGRAVEFVFYPQGSHILTKPSERLASQGGSVDWFLFWLSGYRDADPAKSEQYARWDRLRERAAALRAKPSSSAGQN